VGLGVVGDDFFSILLNIQKWESVLDNLGDALSAHQQNHNQTNATWKFF
jgi:hypothetical protein